MTSARSKAVVCCSSRSSSPQIRMAASWTCLTGPELGYLAVRLQASRIDPKFKTDTGEHILKPTTLDSRLLESAWFGIEAAGKTEADK